MTQQIAVKEKPRYMCDVCGQRYSEQEYGELGPGCAWLHCDGEIVRIIPSKKAKP